MFRRAIDVVKAAVGDFLKTDSSSRGAAIAFYTITSFVPVLIIAIAIAAVVFGEDAARGAVVAQLDGLLGRDGAMMIQDAIESAAHLPSGTVAMLVGIATLIATSSGVFLELRNGLNEIWDVEPQGETLSKFLKARAASLGLVLAFGFVLLISLVLNAAITAFNDLINTYLPFGAVLLGAVNFLVSFFVISLLFGAIYKILPAVQLSWRNVAVGAVTTALLFMVGKLAIGAYLGSGGAGSSFGAAGALIALLFWIYYSAQIVLFGTALTKAVLDIRGVEHPPKTKAAMLSRALRERAAQRH